MKVRTLFTLAISAACAALVFGQAAQKPLRYPDTKKVDQVDNYHGTEVKDPYRWLEDLDSKETAEWVAAQNAVTFNFLESIPARGPIKERLTKLWDYEKFGMPFKEGPRYFWTFNTGLQNQSVLYTADSLTAKGTVLLDPNTLSKDGTVALSGLSVSDNGDYLAYGTSTAGSDWVEYRVRDVRTGQDTADVIKWVKFSGAAWTKDNKGFFYSRYDEPKQGENAMESANYFQKLYYHTLGQPQAEDKLIYERPDQKEWGFGGDVSEDGKYLIISIWQGTERKNRIYYRDLADPNSKITPLLDEFDAQYSFINNDGPVFWFFTDQNAPRGRVIAIDTRKPQRENWKEIIPQAAETLQGANCVGDRFFATYLKDAATQVKVFKLDGQLEREVKLPGLGSAGGFGGKRADKETFYSYTSFNYPPTIFRYDVATGESKVYRQPKVDFDPANYEVKQVFYNSKDGTKIPMFITYRKGVTLDGNNPTILYGYGGFNASITPSFSVTNIVWMEMGGVYAVANIRGGGEYGKDWHNAGKLANKQNCFDDFIAAAEWLVSNKYTSSKRLAISGGSNGGLLVGACMTQRPELFAAALPAVGVMDMLRFQKFTIGWAWTSDYGTSDKPEDFKAQYAYSPLHNLKPGTKYPATLVTTGDHDDRVVPSHSFKFAAMLQACQAGDAPCLIRIETKAGHGAGKPTTKIIEETADRLAFLTKVFGMKAEMPQN